MIYNNKLISNIIYMLIDHKYIIIIYMYIYIYVCIYIICIFVYASYSHICIYS